MEANRSEFKVTAMCRLYGVTRAGFYAWRSRERSKRERQNAALAERIRAVHQASRGTYGSPRIYQALRRQGCRASENRIARVMLRRRFAPPPLAAHAPRWAH
jgi:transposase InsO family protein